MKRLLKKLLSIRISELIVLVVFVPILGSLLNNQNVNVSVTVPPPQDPEITAVTVHPNLKALSISVAGETIYNTQLIWLEDQAVGEAVELTTDTGGYFVAALDESSQLTTVGPHQVIALLEIEQNETILLKSNIVTYTIDEKFDVVLDPINGDVALTVSNITEDEFTNLQERYKLRVLPSSDYEQLKYRWLSYEQMFSWFTVFEWTIYVIILLFIPYLLIRRWRRKKAEHKSFWSLGDGIYFQHEQPK
ncbi:hypothetical protein KKA15_06785 [Patescibacteria group bacterium]|nr:hypothetical protein [Patescibacteria group bacterium]